MTSYSADRIEQPRGRRVIRILRPAEAARPEVRLEDWDGRLVVVKDYSVRATWLKRLIGRYLVRREYVAHARLEGIDGVPQALAHPSPLCLVHDYIEGDPAPSVPDKLTPEFFRALEQLVAEIHRRAAAHGDLTRLENILVRPDGRPAVIDLGATVVAGSNPLAAILLAYLQDDDRRAIAKLKSRCAPHLLTEADRELLERRSWWERLWRRVRERGRRWIQRRCDAAAAEAGSAGGGSDTASGGEG